ncbi:molybdopterin-guanine dinucleotide biosynthesis protein B, partial [Listeria monocytogenes]|nr:molybdopterin-guanine dinucleotide biosynthesis protein B [Listeria monocytogenes]
ATHNPALKKEAIFIGEENALNLFAETLIKEFLK